MPQEQNQGHVDLEALSVGKKLFLMTFLLVVKLTDGQQASSIDKGNRRHYEVWL